MKTIIIGLGNDLLADDAVGLAVAESLRCDGSDMFDVVTTSAAGVGLLDHLVGYDCAVLVDAVVTGNATPGTIHRLQPEDIGAVAAPSPHYAGIPELFAIASELALDYPTRMIIYAIEVTDTVTVGGQMDERVSGSIQAVAQRIRLQVREWDNDPIASRELCVN